MPLFPKDDTQNELEDAPTRMWWTRESGTRKIFIGFISVIVVLGFIWYLRDTLLLRTRWPVLSAEPEGLTVVGTLDSREDSYDRNLFKIVQAEGASRAELTTWGWESIFKESNGKLCTEHNANTIKGVIDVDSEVGYALLQPYLEAAVKREMNSARDFSSPVAETPVSFSEVITKPGFPKQRTLGVLLDYYQTKGVGPQSREKSDSEGAGTGEREVDHGLTIPGESLLHVCPVVLVGRNFTRGWIEENPASIITGRTYSVYLEMTPEGRSRFYQWSRYHAHESLVFILNHEVVTAGRISQTMDVKDWEITNVKDVEAAKMLVDYVNRQGGKSP